LRKSLLDPTSMWSAVLSSVTAPVYSTGPTQAEATTSFPSTKPEAWKFPLGGQSDRVDFALQPALVDNEYISAVLAHSTATYFLNSDFLGFLVHRAQADQAH
jgi:hypothetical protein